MHKSHATLEIEVYGGERTPTYYCEACGKELGYPPITGRCDECEEQHEEENFGRVPAR